MDHQKFKQPTMKSTGLRTSQSSNCKSTSQFKKQLTRPLSNQSLNKSNLSRVIAGRFNNLKTLLPSALGVLTWIFLLCKSSEEQNNHDWRCFVVNNECIAWTNGFKLCSLISVNTHMRSKSIVAIQQSGWVRILLNYNLIERKYLPDGCPQRSLCLMHNQLMIVSFMTVQL